jgi:phage terminase large subunit-like protein
VKLEIYIQPHSVTRRMTFSDTIAALDNIPHTKNMSGEFFVEAVTYRQAAIEEMERRAFAVTPIKEKRARLRVAARYIKMGIVKFPRTGCEQLLTRLLGFGVEKHDDAVDVLVYLILGWLVMGLRNRRCTMFSRRLWRVSLRG